MNVFHGGRSDITELRHRKSCGIYEGDAVLTGHNMLSWLESTARKTAFSTSDSIAINKALADQYLLAVQPPFFFFSGWILLYPLFQTDHTTFNSPRRSWCFTTYHMPGLSHCYDTFFEQISEELSINKWKSEKKSCHPTPTHLLGSISISTSRV